MLGQLCQRRRSTFHRALITGASSGIGEAFARSLPEVTDLLLTARNGDRLAEIQGELGRPGRRVEVVQADLSTPDGREAIVDAAEAFEVDLLINNAGVGGFGAILDNSVEQERATVAVDVVAVTELTRRLVPAMIERAETSGSRAGLINLSSNLAFQPIPRLATYTASKAFVLNYTEALAAELADAPIDVLALCPGPTRTEFGARAGFRMGNLPGAVAPEAVASEGLMALGRRPVHLVGPISQAIFGPGVGARRLVTNAIGVGMRLVGDRLASGRA